MNMPDFNPAGYENNTRYPSKAEYDKFYVYHNGVVIENGLVIWDHDERDEMRAAWRDLGYTIEQKVDWPAYDAAKEVYQAEERRLLDQFKVDITAYYGLTGHPKANLLFDKAWARGHSHGYQEVFNVYDDLVDLVK
jgi:hypothetical protein